MTVSLEQLQSFIAQQAEKQGVLFPIKAPLCFLATAEKGPAPAFGVVRLSALEPGDAPHKLNLRIRGSLPRLPMPGECVTLHLARYEKFRGFQVKSAALASGETRGELFQQTAPGEYLVKGAQTFTVQTTPHALTFMERIPFDEVKAEVGTVPHALVAIAPNANISPRFIYYSDVQRGRLCLYHGDALALKTYQNLAKNPHVTRAVFDLTTYAGYTLRGTCEEFQEADHPEAYAKVVKGFVEGGWGKPARTFRFVANDFAPLEPPPRA